MSKKTFIIPVEGGAVTGYLFEKENNVDHGGLTPLIILMYCYITLIKIKVN